MNSNNTSLLTKKELSKVFWRSFTLEWSWNYERMGHMGFAYALAPVIKKLYSSKEDRAKALQRHLEFFNTTPHVSTLIMSVTAALEEKNVLEKDFDEKTISNIKISLMAPLAGVGDSFFWGTLRIIATGVGTSLALQGNILGPILFLLIFNIPHILLRYYCMVGGYKLGTSFLDRIEKQGLMPSVTYGSAILGLTVIGAMTSEMVYINVPALIGSGDGAPTIQSILDGIMPKLLPLGLTFFLYFLIKKRVPIIYILLGIAATGILGSYLGLLS